MRKEDYPLVEYGAMRLRRCPEPPSEEARRHGDCCVTCVAYQNEQFCDDIQNNVPDACLWLDEKGETVEKADGTCQACVFVLDEKFEDYIVELVRRRVS